MADVPFTTYAYPTTGTPAARTTPARFAEVYNVKDFGAIGTGSGETLLSVYGSGGLAAAQADYPLLTTLTLADTFDWAGIQSAIYTCGANASRGGTVVIPRGNYVVKQGIEINTMNGSIVGSPGGVSFISGNLPNGFIFNQSAGGGGPREISGLEIVNTSTWIGSGGLRVNNTSGSSYNNLIAGGMISYLFGWDIYNSTLNNCTGGPSLDATTGYNGTLGFAGFTPSIKGWRSTGQMQAAIQVAGSNSAHIESCGIENCVTALLLGVYTGWASHCTVAPEAGNPGFSILTVASDAMMGSGAVAGGPGGNPEFQNGSALFGRGLALPPWGSDPSDPTNITGSTWIHNTLTGTGSQGTYRINGTYTITTPIPIWTRSQGLCTGLTVEAIQTEACFHSIYVAKVSGCHISGAGFGVNGPQCSNQWGQTGLVSRAPFYFASGSNTTISGVASAPAVTYLGAIYLQPDAAANGVTFENCAAQKGTDNSAIGTITGDVMTVTTFTSGASIGVGMPVTGTSVLPNTVITGNLATEPLTETVTITIASPGVFTTLTPHGFSANDKIMLYNQGSALPTGLSIRTIYYVITAGMTSTTFKLSAAAGPGTAINTSGTQSGTHYISRLDGSTGLSGFNATGTWRVSPGSQSVSSTTLTIPTGNDWVMPTATTSKTGLKFINCKGTGVPCGLNNLNMAFTSLPGEAGASSDIPRIEGQEFHIVDGAKSGGGTAAIGDATQGGGSQHIKVWWNGTAWIRCG